MRKVAEQLPPDELYLQLQNKACALEKILVQKKKALENAPEGSLRVTICNKNKQFYWVKKGEIIKTENSKSENSISKEQKKSQNGTYIPHSKMDFARQLAQKEYDADSIEAIETELTLIKTYLKKSRFNKTLHSKLPARKLELVEPLTLEDDEYAREWLQIPYQKKESKAGKKSFPTSGGLLVRSKSEVIIAEMLEKNGIPFRYEQKLRLSAFNVHPDFVCLNIRTRQEFAWEHLGLLDDSEYSKMAAEKLHFYQKSGYFPGKNLIITTESQDFPLSSELVQEVIDQYLR